MEVLGFVLEGHRHNGALVFLANVRDPPIGEDHRKDVRAIVNDERAVRAQFGGLLLDSVFDLALGWVA